MHVLIRVRRRRVSDHRDLVTELGGEAYRCLHAGVRDESDDDELMNAVPLELHIQIGWQSHWNPSAREPRSRPGCGANSLRISPLHVPYSKVLFDQAAFWTGAMYVQVSESPGRYRRLSA